MKPLVLALLCVLIGCASARSVANQDKKDACGATVSVAPQPASLGVCR